jgi:15-cis-phytoene synthase
MTTLSLDGLLARAYEADKVPPAKLPAPATGRALLARAYEHCRRLTAVHSRSFFLASGLLPAPKRQAVWALYAFCRTADDIVDDQETADATRNSRGARLAAWRVRALSTRPPAGDLVALAWADTRRRYSMPDRYIEQLIDGVGRDLAQQRYHTFDEVAGYAYGVASTVGLLSIHIVGYAGPHAIPYAIKLGVALQLTNILRDVGEDWRAGRLYLPAVELAAFDLTEADLAAGRVDDRWRAFMRYQIERNRRLYAEAWPGIALLNRDGRLAIAAAAHLYRAILADIEAHDYDVFGRRAHVTAGRKLRCLAAAWLSVRRP